MLWCRWRTFPADQHGQGNTPSLPISTGKVAHLPCLSTRARYSTFTADQHGQGTAPSLPIGTAR
eukprot:365888-Chlamydomonas_euryale.AAC.8